MNYLLNDKMREFYKPAIDILFEECPTEMARKIPEANVQQAFVYSAVAEIADKSTSILSVGAYEDTAFLTLNRSGYNIFGIDPVWGHSLDDWYWHGKGEHRYDIIFSTSVIEHVENDELFIEQICKMLKVGGIGILTCDFRDDYKEGDPKPGEDQRLYTTYDLCVRLSKILEDNGCKLTNEPDYSGEPDFTYGIYKYSFATFVFHKHK